MGLTCTHQGGVLGRFPLGIRDDRRGASELGRFAWMSVVRTPFGGSASWLCEHLDLSPPIATTAGKSSGPYECKRMAAIDVSLSTGKVGTGGEGGLRVS